MVVSDGRGNVFEVPGLVMCGMSAGAPVTPGAGDLIELPYGSDLMELPGRAAVGFDPQRGAFVEVEEVDGRAVVPVAAFMAPAYLQILTAAYAERSGAPRLPMYAYTAVGWLDGRFVAAGTRIDKDRRQDLAMVDCRAVEAAAAAALARFPANRLVAHLVNNCVRRYGCPAARNFVLQRWECPIPTSRRCNASCLGCLSLQQSNSGVKAAHDRIAFTPSAGEIVEFAAHHLEHAPRPVVSFGQGCEGEPLTEADLIEEAIAGIRKRTRKGVINLNTNGSIPAAVERLCAAGLDSIRVSLNSARSEFYHKYFRPRGYGFDDVMATLRTAREHGVWRSINYFIFPGFTDCTDEMAALDKLLTEPVVDMIQTRNLNIDPLWALDKLGIGCAPGQGIRRWIERMRDTHPRVRLGYFNPPISVMLESR